MDSFLQSAWLSGQGTSGQSPEMPWLSDVVWMVRKSKLRCNRGGKRIGDGFGNEKDSDGCLRQVQVGREVNCNARLMKH